MDCRTYICRKGQILALPFGLKQPIQRIVQGAQLQEALFTNILDPAADLRKVSEKCWLRQVNGKNGPL